MPTSELCRIQSRGQLHFLSIAGCRSPAILGEVGIIPPRLGIRSGYSTQTGKVVASINIGGKRVVESSYYLARRLTDTLGVFSRSNQTELLEACPKSLLQ